MKRVFILLLLILLSVPCLLTFNDVDALTGDYNISINLVGLAYSHFYFKYILKPIFK